MKLEVEIFEGDVRMVRYEISSWDAHRPCSIREALTWALQQMDQMEAREAKKKGASGEAT